MVSTTFSQHHFRSSSPQEKGLFGSNSPNETFQDLHCTHNDGLHGQLPLRGRVIGICQVAIFVQNELWICSAMSIRHLTRLDGLRPNANRYTILMDV